MAEAQKAAASAKTPEECSWAIYHYLQAWRKDHLYVDLLPQARAAAGKETTAQLAGPKQSADPTYRELSPKTILLTLPTFEYPMHDKLEALLKAHHEALANHPNWIIDVRDNYGGSSTSYWPLAPWLLPDEIVIFGVEWLSTPANIQGSRDACAIFEPGNKDCEKSLDEVARKMEKVPPGGWVPNDDQGGVYYSRADSVEQHRPSRVVVLIDRQCISACEEFALEVRQSFTVKLIGRHTGGVYDYSNLRPHTLPSGNLRLWYATSRSVLVPDQPVDLAGVSPDIYLPLGKESTAKDDEIKRVQNWLEGGSLAPLKTDASNPQTK